MTLPAWWQVATPHKDIREKSFSEAVFAADLGDVVAGRAPVDYQDPVTFFEKTYLTEGLKKLARNAVSRLSGGLGDAVIQLKTPFGGGKTHSLLALYHLAKSYSQVKHLEAVKEIGEAGAVPPGTRVAAFVGTSADPVRGRTPWGEIAYQLGCYEIMEEHDRRRVAPGKDRIREMLQRSGLVLILVDELLEYVVKANRVEKLENITRGQTLAFIQELSEAVGASDNSMLVMTLPASVIERYDEEAEMTLAQIQNVSARVESIYTPVEGAEIYEVIRRRLFEDCGSPDVQRTVAGEYFKLYQSLQGSVPADVLQVAYREKIERAYPFHPEFIDVLYQRWGSFSTFQRTRGVLRLVAMVVGELYERKVPTPLIHSCLADLSVPRIRSEFLRHIGNEYDSIIAHDITTAARGLDREMGTEYEKYQIASRLATSVFLYSFSGSEKRGTTLPWLRVAVLSEGIQPPMIGDAVTRLDNSLWYFHSEKGVYSFRNEANLNRIIVEREEAIQGSPRIKELLQDKLKEMSRSPGVDVYVWPGNSSDVPDSPRLKLAVLDPQTSTTDGFAAELAGRAGLSPRIFRNALFLVAVDPATYPGLERALRHYLALEDISRDPDISLSARSREELKSRLETAKKDLPRQVLTAYRLVGWAPNGGVMFKDMSIPTIGSGESLAQRVLQYLKDEQKLLSSMTPKLVLDRGFAQEEMEKPLREVYDLFLKTPGLPCLESQSVLLSAVSQGARNKILGVRAGKVVYFGQEPPGISLDDVVMRPEQAEKALAEKKLEPTDRDWGNGPEIPPLGGREMPGQETGGGSPEGRRQVVKSLRIRATLPWDKVSNLVMGVLKPLKDRGGEPKITVEIEASSPDGFDRMTLDLKVRETLQQLGSAILQWDEME